MWSSVIASRSFLCAVWWGHTLLCTIQKNLAATMVTPRLLFWGVCSILSMHNCTVTTQDVWKDRKELEAVANSMHSVLYKIQKFKKWINGGFLFWKPWPGNLGKNLAENLGSTSVPNNHLLLLMSFLGSTAHWQAVQVGTHQWTTRCFLIWFGPWPLLAAQHF